MLRDYEILYIIRPELDEEPLAQAVKTIETLVGNLGGRVEKSDIWGRRRLAYEVDHLREGHYVLTTFQLDPQRVRELDAAIKISETVFRHLITRIPEKTRAARQPAAKEQPAAREPVSVGATPAGAAAEAAAGEEEPE